MSRVNPPGGKKKVMKKQVDAAVAVTVDRSNPPFALNTARQHREWLISLWCGSYSNRARQAIITGTEAVARYNWLHHAEQKISRC